MREVKAKLEAAQQELALKKSDSNNRKKAVRTVTAIHRQTANKRRDFLHKTSSELVATTDLIVTESLIVANMTRSAGTVQEPGRNVAQKAGGAESGDVLDGLKHVKRQKLVRCSWKSSRAR